MRQIFSSPRLENVEAVAKLLNEQGIETKTSDARSYKQVSRREFSYIEGRRDTTTEPAVWVVKSDDYKRSRELLHQLGLLDATQAPSYVPEALQFKQAPVDSPQKRMMRLRMTLLFVVGGMVFWIVLRMAFGA